jgi:hypothetical protein
MRNRLSRSLGRFAIWLSMFLLLAGIALWCRSYHNVEDHLIRYSPRGTLAIESTLSSIHLWRDPSASQAEQLGYPGWTYYYGSFARSSRLWGLTELSLRKNGRFNIWIPYWLVCLVLLSPLATRLAGIQRRRRISRLARGLCTSCGYDLRASAAKCPECGAACKAADPAGVSPAAGD